MSQVQIAVISAENTELTLAVPGHQGAGGATGAGVPVGGTTGQILEKVSNTDYDTQWADAPIGNITGVTAGTGLSGGGTSGNVTLNLNASIDALTDVDTTTTPPTNGQALAWDNANSEWIPMDMAGTADLGYIAGSSSGEVTSSTGTNATIPGFTSTNAGLAGASGGGTTNFLRADGTWIDPPGTTNLTYTTAATTGTINSSTGTDATIPKFTATDAGLVHGSGGGTANFLRADGTWDAPSTNLGYTPAASQGTVTSSNGTSAILPEFTSTEAGLVSGSGGGTTNYLRADGGWNAPVGTTNLGYTAAPAQGTVTSDTGTDATVPVFDSTNAGLVGGSGGGTTNFLRADGTWSTPAGGPAGSDTQVQFNDGGVAAGDTGLTFDKTTNALTVGASTVDGGSAKIYGDINLDDGGSFSTTVQAVTPTANRTISFPDATGTVALVSGANGTIQYNDAGTLKGNSDFTVNVDWDNPATTFTALKVNVPDATQGAADSKLLDLQVGGTSKFNVSSSGSVVGADLSATTGIYTSKIFQSGGIGVLSLTGANIAQWVSGAFNSYGSLGIRVATAYTVLDADAANTLAQRNGTDSQTFRLYNTYTDASNYERGAITWDANVFKIGTENDGTGTARSLTIQTGGTDRVTLGGGNGLTIAGNVSQIFADCVTYFSSTTAAGSRASAGNGFKVGSAYAYSFSSTTGANGTPDIALVRDSAGVVKVTDGSTGTGYLRQEPIPVGDLPTAAAGNAGTRIFVSDSNVGAAGNFGAVVADGGSNVVPVYSDGGAWRIG